MEEGEIHHSLEEEVRGLNVSIGNEETENGHRERFDLIELAKTMRNLKMEV